MKATKILAVASCLSVGVFGFWFVGRASGGNDNDDFPVLNAVMSGGKMLDRMSSKLDLSDKQKQQVKTIVSAEAVSDAPAISQMKHDVTALRSMADSDTVDRTQLTNIAQSTSATAVDLIVDLARTKSKINAVLTPDQKVKEKQLQSEGLANLHSRIAAMQSKRGRMLEFVASRLDLSDDQISQAKTILADQRTTARPEVIEIGQDLKDVQALTRNGTFDEAAVRAQAEKAQKPMEELIIDSIQTKSQLFALLTPDQKLKVEAMQHSFRAKLAERIMERLSHQDNSDTQSVI